MFEFSNQRAALTIFTCPKPFTDPHIRTIQRNAIQSWMQLKPRPEILLMGDDEGVRETAEEFGLRHIPDIQKNEYGTPLVSSIWREAEKVALNDLMAYVNADIILCQNFIESSSLCIRIKRFLLIGQRWDFNHERTIDFRDGNWSAMVELLSRTGCQHEVNGIDYYGFRRGLWRDIPAFAVGRFAWDNWLVYGACREGAMLIDGSSSIKAYHQDHGYIHTHPMRDLRSCPEAIRNISLAAGHNMNIGDCTHKLLGSKIVRIKVDNNRIERRLELLQRYRPRFFVFLKSWKVREAFCRKTPQYIIPRVR